MALRELLASPVLYNAYRALIGGGRINRTVVEEYLQPGARDRVLDIGCGPAGILAHLPAGVQYVGFDLSRTYIEAAKRRYGSRGTYYCAAVSRDAIAGLELFDRALAFGVLHHLADPEGAELLKLALAALKPGGRLLTVDPAWVRGQSPVARFLIRNDRGEHVRTPDEYGELARRVFPHVHGQVRHDLLRIPFTHHLMTCRSAP